MFPPIEQIPDARESDVRLDACVTPTDIFTFQRSISPA
jgi:hypothetical protein